MPGPSYCCAMSDISSQTGPTAQYPAPAASVAPAPSAGPAPAAPPPTAPRPPRRPLPGWGWGLIIAGTAVVALLIGGGFGFGAGLFAAHVGQSRTSVVHPGSGGGMPGGGMGSHPGKQRFGGSPASPASAAPSPSATPTS